MVGILENNLNENMTFEQDRKEETRDKSVSSISSSSSDTETETSTTSSESTISDSGSDNSSSSVRSSEATVLNEFKTILINSNKQKCEMKAKTKINSNSSMINCDEDEEHSTTDSTGLDNSSNCSPCPSSKIYQNSPFGLTRHYLTMPDDNVQSNIRFNGDQIRNVKLGKPGVGIYNDDSELNQAAKLTARGFNSFVDNGDAGGQLKSLSLSEQSIPQDNLMIDTSYSQTHNLNNNKRRQHQLNEETGDPILMLSSSGGGLSSSASSPWSDHYSPHDLQQNEQHLIKPDKTSSSQLPLKHSYRHYPNNSPTVSPLMTPSLIAPAGDAGLDAKKCNAKDSCYFNDPITHHETTDHHLKALELKREKLAKSLGGSGGELPLTSSKKHLNNHQEYSGLLVRFSSIMYATFLVILGCILHVSELRQKSKNSSDHIYTTIVALIGILWLLFLQTDLQRYKKYASKYILIETIFNDHRQQKLINSQSDPTVRSTTSSSASLVNDRISMNTEVIFKKTAYKMYQRRAELDRFNQNHNHNHQHHPHLKNNHHNPYEGRKRTLSKSSSSQASSSTDLYKPIGTSNSTSSLTSYDVNKCDNLIPAYKFLHGKMGANFYLKCGMAAFCFGHVIHEGLRFGQQLYFFGDGNIHCRDSAALVAHLVTPLYSFYQLFMMFKYSNLVINRHKILARFGLMHIIGTSITFWFRTILEEAFEDFVHKMDYFRTNKPQMSSLATGKTNQSDSNFMSLLTSFSNSLKTEATERSDWSYSSPDQQVGANNISMAQSLFTLMSSPISATITPQLVRHLPDSYACAQNTLLTTKSMNALPYLYPFTIEYNLLLAATFLSLYFNIGKIGAPGHEDSRCDLFVGGSRSNQVISAKQHNFNSRLQIFDGSPIANRSREESEKDLGEYKSNFVVNADCHSANKGLFCGFFVLLVTLVTIVIFFVTINKPTHIQLGIKINLIQEATLTALILIVTLAGFKQVVKLNRNPYLKDKVTTDDVLMLIPLPFFFIHSLLSFRAETASMSSGSIPGFSSLLLHGNNHHNLHTDSMTTTTRNLQSILLSTNNSNNSNNNSNTHIEANSRLNNLLVSRTNGSNGRFAEEFIGNTNKSSISSNNNNNHNNNINNNSNNNNNHRSVRRNISADGIDAGNINNNNHNGGNSSQIDHFKLITVALNIIVMIEVLVQTNFIIDGMRRCSESRYLRFKKPGRELITFAILLNITYWIVATFETKSVEQYKTEIEYYGPLPYMFISHTTLPVMLFYRYHSSVCLAEIWNRAYKPPKKR